MVNPFDLRSAVFAKHAQHVVLIHFPIALFITSVGFDYLALWTKNRTVAAAAFVAGVGPLAPSAAGLNACALSSELPFG